MNVVVITFFALTFRHRRFGFNNRTHCDYVRNVLPGRFRSQYKFLDLIDTVVMDYLSYHMDTKYYYLLVFPSTTVHIDRGRA